MVGGIVRRSARAVDEAARWDHVEVRIFAAIVPPPQVVESLEEFLSSRQEADRDLRWTLPDQWHVTLAFSAQAPERSEDDLLERLTRAGRRRRAFRMRLGGVGAFPHVARGRVLYLASVIESPWNGDEELLRLATGARAAFAKAGCPVEGSKFTPHNTLARLGRPSDLTRWVRVVDTFAGDWFTVEEFVLLESHLGQGPRGKPRYEERGRFSIGGRAETDS